MTDTKWGAPLTGAQMKLLRAAGLPDGTVICAWQDDHAVTLPLSRCSYCSWIPYSLPANHPAYTLLNAGWLDGRNVRLWFGGDKAPDDWVEYSEVLLRDGHGGAGIAWNHFDCKNDIIAYIAKDEVAEQPETVTIAKMTPDEIMERFCIPTDEHHRSAFGRGGWMVLSLLGLIKEPTREERFWALHEPEGTTVPTHIKKWVKDALEFER